MGWIHDRTLPDRRPWSSAAGGGAGLRVCRRRRPVRVRRAFRPTCTKVRFGTATVSGFYISDGGPVRFNLKTFPDVQIKSGVAKTTNFTTFAHT